MTSYLSAAGRYLLIALFSILLASPAEAADLYRVEVTSKVDAAALMRANADAIKRFSGGYLILADQTMAQWLVGSGLDVRLVATDVSRPELAVDVSHGEFSTTENELIYDSDNIRLFRIDESAVVPPGMARVMPIHLPIVYSEPATLQLSQEDVVDLDSLTSLISADSLRSYVEQLQRWIGRYPGRGSYTKARNWLMGKLATYGCDSVVIDEFEAPDSWTDEIVTWQNILGYKTGREYPINYILVSAHWDSSPVTSPGADDNASGCAAVLEIARVLCQADTRFTFVFAMFDGEERGLNGSEHHAAEVFARGDSIAVVANLDVIGYYTGVNYAYLVGMYDGTYGLLWRSLADSLPQAQIDSILLGSGLASDHRPFFDRGMNAVSVFAYVYNPYMHTPHDSAVYLDFNYTARIVKVTLAATYITNATYSGLPMALDIPGGAPELFYPDQPVSLELAATLYGDASIVPGSGMIHYVIDDNPLVSDPLVALGGGRFGIVLPAQSCNSQIQYYFSIDEVTSGTWYYPDTTNVFVGHVATRAVTVFEDDFNTDKGWTVMGDADPGMWERCIPDPGTAHAYPRLDYDKSGSCYVTCDGNLSVSQSTTRLISPLIEIPHGRALIKYARWFHNNTRFGTGTPWSDVFQVFVRRQGTGFVVAETVGPVEQADGGWFESGFWVNDILEPTTPVQVMFDVSDTGAVSVLEGGVDAFEVRVYTCDLLIITESLPDWTALVPYSMQLEAAGGNSPFIWTDKNNDLAGFGLTLSTTGLLSGTPTSSGTVSFTAVATDGESAADERQYTLQINAPVTVVTTTLPDGKQGVAYSLQLQVSGGTGDITCHDRDDDLTAHGLVVSPEGLLSGTPTDTGMIAFTARAEDEVGSVDEQLLNLRIGPSYICGDVDNNGVGVDISDITYFVDWMFGGGSAPPIIEAANVDYGIGGTAVDVSDLTYMVDYMFGGGPAPDCE